MSGLLSFANYTKIVAERDFGAVLFQAVVDGMAPFKVKNVELEYVYDIDFHRYWIMADAHGYNWRFAFKEPADGDELSWSPEAAVEKLGSAFFKAFQQRGAASVPDNVVLGEN